MGTISSWLYTPQTPACNCFAATVSWCAVNEEPCKTSHGGMMVVQECRQGKEFKNWLDQPREAGCELGFDERNRHMQGWK